MNKKKLKYYAFFGRFNSIGIEKKLENTVQAAAKIGYDAEVKHYLNRPSGLLKFIKDIIFGREEVIILRLYDLFMPFIFPFLVLRRLKGTQLILDVSTPRQTQLKEFQFDNKGKLHIFIRSVWNYLSWTWVCMPFNRIIQYAEESFWFSAGVKYKTIKMGNGIKIDNDTPLAASNATETINIIGVATLARWHGYDRLIKAVALLKDREPDFPIKVKIVGEGQAQAELHSLVHTHNLEGVIEFTGALHGDDLTSAFNGYDYGVGSLGLFRIGLEEAAILKTREYMARGLVVIGAGSDPDFPENSPYRLLAPNDESIEPIVELLLKLKGKPKLDGHEIRNFSIENLSFDAKIKKILGLEK